MLCGSLPLLIRSPSLSISLTISLDNSQSNSCYKNNSIKILLKDNINNYIYFFMLLIYYY